MLKKIIGQRFGNLVVIERAEDFVRPSGKKDVQYLCQCDCGNCIITKSFNLLHKNKRSCGCVSTLYHHTENVYDLTGEYGIGYTTNTNKKFYFDLDDYELIKDNCWWEATNGYVVSNGESLHRKIMNANKNEIIDHINHDTLDNRKCNLRKCTTSQNNINKGKISKNTSGYTGVTYRKDRKKWVSRITIDKKTYYLGNYSTIEEAVDARKKAENKYFKEWSYDNSIKIINRIQE